VTAFAATSEWTTISPAPAIVKHNGGTTTTGDRGSPKSTKYWVDMENAGFEI
jgi:hypothetical protein